MAATEPMRGDPRIHQVSGDISCYRQQKVFASSAGSFLEQMTTEISGGDAAYLKDVGSRFDRFLAGQKPMAEAAAEKKS